jgi:hypothetical protein
MVTTLLLASVLLSAAQDPLPPDLPREDQLAYQEAKTRAGLDPDANVRLAIWCEAHGLRAERVKHLALAVLHDPSNAAARGLLGLVAYRGDWKSPEAVAEDARSDGALQAALAEYNGRREEMPETADAHWALGLWCESNRLGPEALAHFTAVTRIAPDRADAWLKLGFRKSGGRWISESQLAAERVEADAQRQADARWTPRLKQWWKDWLADKDHRPDRENALADTLEPRAVPTIRTLFLEGTATQQRVAAQLLDRIDSPEATQELARLATRPRSPEVRQEATQALVRRDPGEVIEPLIGLMHAPMDVNVTRGQGRDVVAELRVEDEQAVLRKIYVQRNVRVQSGRTNPGFLAPALAPRMTTRTAQQQLSRDLRTVAGRNAARGMINDSASVVLAEITGEDLGPEPESWRQWLMDRKGYAYQPPASTAKPVVTRVSQHVNYSSAGFHSNCFAKGTPVRTLLGLRPIETLRVGDRVLSEDPGSGTLSFQPIVFVYHNPPSPTLKITLDSEVIVSTPIHRFWRSGKGWALARELKPGDPVRVLGGLAKVKSVESDDVQPVFNLELAQGHSFFVGQQGALVHDNSRMQPTSGPFDAAPPLSAVARRAGEVGVSSGRSR